MTDAVELALNGVWLALQACAAVSLASAPWVLLRQRRRVDDLSSFCSWSAALPGMALFMDRVVLSEMQGWTWLWAWPLYVLGILCGGMWLFGGPWLLAMALRHRPPPRSFRALDVIQLFHAGCWLTSTALPFLVGLAWLVTV